MEEHGAVTKHIAEESLSFEILACVLAFVDCVRLEGCKHKSDGYEYLASSPPWHVRNGALEA